MAASDAIFTTARDDGEVRRRNIQTYEKANGGTVYKIDAEDTKKLHKVSSNRALPT
jgi:general stress protein 26